MTNTSHDQGQSAEGERPPLQFSLRFLFLLVAAASICCAVGTAYYRTFVVPFQPKFLTSEDEWPVALRRLVANAESAKVQTGRIDVYGSEYSERYYWKMSASPELFEFLTVHWQLAPLSGPPSALQYFLAEMPETWRNTAKDHKMKWWASVKCFAGGKGDHYVVLHDLDSDEFIVSYKDVF